jgi:hypothetical protein
VEVRVVDTFILFFRDLWASWIAWVGGILRMIPFVEDLFEPWLRRKFPRIDVWFVAHGVALKKNLKLIGVICLFIGCYRAWVFEHRNAETAMYGPNGKSEAWSKYNACDRSLAVKTALADTYSSQIAEQRGRLDSEQDTFNRCILSMGQKNTPEPLKIDVMRWKIPVTYTFANAGKVQFWTLVALTNRPINATRGTLTCDAPFQSLRSALLTHGNSLQSDYEQISPNSVHVEFLYPPWSAQNPLVFSVDTPEGKDINSCSFKLD